MLQNTQIRNHFIFSYFLPFLLWLLVSDGGSTPTLRQLTLCPWRGPCLQLGAGGSSLSPCPPTPPHYCQLLLIAGTLWTLRGQGTCLYNLCIPAHAQHIAGIQILMNNCLEDGGSIMFPQNCVWASDCAAARNTFFSLILLCSYSLHSILVCVSFGCTASWLNNWILYKVVPQYFRTQLAPHRAITVSMPKHFFSTNFHHTPQGKYRKEGHREQNQIRPFVV